MLHKILKQGLLSCTRLLSDNVPPNVLITVTCCGTKHKKHHYARAWVKHPFCPRGLNPVIRLLPMSPRV